MFESYKYDENYLSGILFDVINAYATTFDVVFLFGHNHSGNYDDYIGGSASYIGKNETIYIPSRVLTDTDGSKYIMHNGEKITSAVYGAEYYTAETLNFTYMNYGYIGYTNNAPEGGTSTNWDVHSDSYPTNSSDKSTMGVFEICPDKIAVSRYSTSGLYRTYEIDRVQKTNTPSVSVAGYTSGTIGSATGALATASGFTDPVYTWTSSDNQIAKISANGRAAQISYNKAGTATVTVTV